MSDRPEDRPVPPLARMSARNARTRTDGTDDETSTDRSASTGAERPRPSSRNETGTPSTEKETTTQRRRAKPRTGTLGGSNRMLSSRDVAAILAVPERTVREKWREWQLPAYRIGKHLRWKEREVHAWIDRHAA